MPCPKRHLEAGGTHAANTKAVDPARVLQLAKLALKENRLDETDAECAGDRLNIGLTCRTRGDTLSSPLELPSIALATAVLAGGKNS